MKLPAMSTTHHQRIRKTLNFVLAAGLTIVIATAMYVLFHFFNIHYFIEELELKTYDWRAMLQVGESPARPSRDIVIVKFDDATLNLFGDEYGVWPWPRKVQAEVVDFLNRAGAKMIAFDIMFVSHQRGSEASDQVFIDSFKRHKNVYLGMNFDNEQENSRKLKKDLTWQDVQQVLPLSIPLKAHTLNPELLTLDDSGFFNNDAMTFNHYRSLMPGLMENQARIAFINHSRDPDGVSRSNPLFFRYQAEVPIRTEHLPVRYDEKKRIWHDAAGVPVSPEGYLLRPGFLRDNESGSARLLKPVTRYFPYLGLRLLLDLKYPNQRIPLTLTAEGHLKFGQHNVPLRSNGNFLIRWYNVNLEQEYYTGLLAELQNRKARLREQGGNLAAIQQIDTLIGQFEAATKRHYEPRPYREISALEVFRAIRNERAGHLSQEDRQLVQLLKNKVIFVGTTAVATYDIKNTSISKSLPGVLMQASLFDNLMQNTHYMRRAQPRANVLITATLCLFALFAIFKMRSAVAGLLTTATLAVIYILLSLMVFQRMDLWINVAMPLVMLVTTTLATFIIKYIVRNEDYEKTYQMATTDSMTGLYNHRFFQEQLLRSIEQADRFNHKFSLILIDIDFFKKFNDTYGHQAGDEVLRCVAQKLKATVRSVDVVARYGGEEMAVILDRATEQEALDIARKLVKAVSEEAYPIADGVAKHVTISAGVATYPVHGATAQEVLEFSDKALYRAKENGRNQVGAQYDGQKPHPLEDQTASA